MPRGLQIKLTKVMLTRGKNGYNYICMHKTSQRNVTQGLRIWSLYTMLTKASKRKDTGRGSGASGDGEVWEGQHMRETPRT